MKSLGIDDLPLFKALELDELVLLHILEPDSLFLLHRLQVTSKIKDPFHKSQALIDLAPELKYYMPVALSIIREMEQDIWKANTLIAYTPYIEKWDWLGRVLAIIQLFSDSFYKSEVLITYLPQLCLQNRYLHYALLIAETIEDSHYRKNVLKNLSRLSGKSGHHRNKHSNSCLVDSIPSFNLPERCLLCPFLYPVQNDPVGSCID